MFSQHSLYVKVLIAKLERHKLDQQKTTASIYQIVYAKMLIVCKFWISNYGLFILKTD